MAVFGCKRLFSAKLILNLSAMTSALPFDVEILSFVVDAVWFSELPLIFLSVCGIARLELMGILILRHV